MFYAKVSSVYINANTILALMDSIEGIDHSDIGFIDVADSLHTHDVHTSVLALHPPIVAVVHLQRKFMRARYACDQLNTSVRRANDLAHSHSSSGIVSTYLIRMVLGTSKSTSGSNRGAKLPFLAHLFLRKDETAILL